MNYEEIFTSMVKRIDFKYSERRGALANACGASKWW